MAVAADLDSIDADPPPFPVCRLELAKVPLGRPDHSDMMDWHSLQASWIDQELLDADGELREDRLDHDALVGGSALLVVTELEVEPAYAGLGVGRLLDVEAIAWLGGGSDLAAVVTIDAWASAVRAES